MQDSFSQVGSLSTTTASGAACDPPLSEQANDPNVDTFNGEHNDKQEDHRVH